MEGALGLLRIRVRRGINLAIRDSCTSSDPFVVVTMGSQACESNFSRKLKTKLVTDNCNPIWNDELTLSIKDPDVPIKLEVFDKDTFTRDDPMGEAEIDIKPYLECLQMGLQDLPTGTKVGRVQPNRKNYLADESCIVWNNGKIIQDMCLRLGNVECGELEVQVEWIDIPGHRDLRSSEMP
ncbi:hypothetical protein RJ639_006913 [Escallonia herrerae]|uniref:C2 domain-containing protein n=1 Tax=Escallonia herrerae TaxID=1293975 RepID=A0AA88W0J6_9ASTE|nr:hypothetical protein RJ639_006913 [Escallonia herrerae]